MRSDEKARRPEREPVPRLWSLVSNVGRVGPSLHLAAEEKRRRLWRISVAGLENAMNRGWSELDLPTIARHLYRGFPLCALGISHDDELAKTARRLAGFWRASFRRDFAA
jgi:hypothetical protein